MGSSAGGHLAAFTSTYYEPIDFEGTDEIDNEDFIPNGQILCYPVINIYDTYVGHIASGNNLIDDTHSYNPYDLAQRKIRRKFSPDLIVSEKTPKAFIWHTFEDESVNVRNSLDYSGSLKNFGIDAEIHIFPHGHHGLGLTEKSNKLENHVAQWGELLVKWINYIE